jgi:collagen beta-1,O-galactosyltransferase
VERTDSTRLLYSKYFVSSCFRDTWKGYFPQRDLVALSAAPLLVFPTHYTGEKGYVSDTEDSTVIKSAPPLSTKEDL